MKSLSFRKDLVGVQDELLRFAYKLTTDREEANDLLQETSLKALDNEDKYMPDTNFKGWMYTIMRNIFINNYRKTVRDQTFVDQTDNLFHLNFSQESGFDSTEGAYDLKEIHRVVNALPKDYRAAGTHHRENKVEVFRIQPLVGIDKNKVEGFTERRDNIEGIAEMHPYLILMGRLFQVFHDEVFHFVVDLKRMDQSPFFQPFRHTKSSISCISTDLKHTAGTKHPAKHLQYPPLQMPRQHSRTKQVHIRIPVQGREQCTFFVTMRKDIFVYCHLHDL